MELRVDGHPVFAAIGGRPFDAAQRAVVLVHGAGMDHSYWQLQSRWFAWHGWSVLAVDLPGHRGSGGEPLATIEAMGAWVGRLIDAAGLDTATLVGHSMGALVVLQAAALLPEKIDHLALLGVADAIEVHPELLAAAKADDPLAFDLVTSWGHGPAAHVGRNTVPGIWMLGGARQLLARGRPGVLYCDLKACDEWTGGIEAAKAVRCPTLIISGDEDVMTPPKRTETVVNLIAGCTQVMIENCGHMMIAEAPDATLDALVAAFH